MSWTRFRRRRPGVGEVVRIIKVIGFRLLHDRRLFRLVESALAQGRQARKEPVGKDKHPQEM